jgi:crotonobetainyl-CoA:carnitine CoA-transferase CaiB-like acyl-CoA transferase
MFDAQLAMLSYQAAYALIGGVTPPPQGSRHDSIPTYRVFRAGDGREVAITANTDGMWREACKVLGREDLLADPRYETAATRLANRDALWAEWEAAFARQPASVWVEQLNAVGVPAAMIRTVPEALADAEAAGRQMVLALDDGKHEAKVVGSPLRMGDTTGDAHRYPPRLSADADDILRGAGLTDAQIAEMRTDRVVL